MKLMIPFLSLLFTVCTSVAQSNNSEVIELITKIETTSYNADMCVWISDTNKLVQLGDAAVDTLISVLQSNSYGDLSKWSAALALGEIGNDKAYALLTDVAAKNPIDSQGFYLGSVAKDAASKIQGSTKKEGKFRKKTYAVQTTITDCETGDVKVVQ